jgi:hypothetical protein
MHVLLRYLFIIKQLGVLTLLLVTKTETYYESLNIKIKCLFLAEEV